jgi:sortase A
MVWRWAEKVLLAAGIAGIGIWIIANLASTAFQHWQNSVFERERQAGPVARNGNRRLPFASGSLVGRLAVPRLHLRAMVRENDGEGTLSLGLGHIPGTALPGQSGNVGVAGHRDTLFRGLKSIRKNDLIEFQTLDSSYTYRVEDTLVVKPENLGALEPGSYAELTLVTCYPFGYVGPAPDRFIVKARQVSGKIAGRDTGE